MSSHCALTQSKRWLTSSSNTPSHKKHQLYHDSYFYTTSLNSMRIISPWLQRLPEILIPLLEERFIWLSFRSIIGSLAPLFLGYSVRWYNIVGRTWWRKLFPSWWPRSKDTRREAGPSTLQKSTPLMIWFFPAKPHLQRSPPTIILWSSGNYHFQTIGHTRGSTPSHCHLVGDSFHAMPDPKKTGPTFVLNVEASPQNK